MDFNIEIRKKQLQNLEQYIDSSSYKITSVLNCLAWTAEHILKDEELATCPINNCHKFPEKYLSTHMEKCSLRSRGYNFSDVFLSEPTHNPTSSIIIDEDKLQDIMTGCKQNFEIKSSGHKETFPKTCDRLLSTYTPEERLRIYDYANEQTTGPEVPPEFSLIPVNNSNRALTSEELMKLERDSKRRRTKYKSVHTNKKSHTEVIRDVINSQMDQYKDWVEECSNINKKDWLEESEKYKNTEKCSEKDKRSDDYHYSSKRRYKDNDKYYRRSRERIRSPYSRNGDCDRRSYRKKC